MSANFYRGNQIVDIFSTDEIGDAILVKCLAANIPSAVVGYSVGCELIARDTGTHYYNTGTRLSCTFVAVGTVTAGSVVLASLDAGISPSHVVKFAGTASGGTTATRAYTVTGALSTDVATAVIRASTNAASIQKATLSTDTLTVLFSTDPGANTTVDYSVLRAAV